MEKKRNRTILSALALCVGLFFVTTVFAFNGPTASPGVGGGSLTIDGNGNVGVGTVNSTPGTGSFGRIFAVASGTNPGVFLKSGSGSSYVLYTKTASSSFSIWDETAGADRFVINSSGNISVSGNITATAFVGTLSGDVSSANVSSGVFGSLQGNGAFAFPASLGVATSSKVGLPASLSVYGDGFVRDNLGIGTGSPSSKLHLYTTGTTLDALLETSGGMKTIVGIDTTSPYAGASSNHPFRLFVNNLEKVRIATSGYVGIGTTAPQHALSVSGEIYATGSSTASAFCLSGTCQTSWNNLGQWTTATGGIYYQGKVSAGTSTISYPLFVSTSTDSLFALHRIGATYPTIFKQGTDGVLIMSNANTDTLTLKDGLVGIGTTSPGQRLTVASSSGISIDATSGRIVNLGTPSATTDATTKAYVDNAVAGTTSYFSLNGTSLYPTSTTYKFGIGTTTPAYGLSVVGDANTTGAFRISALPVLALSGAQLQVGNSASITSLGLFVGGDEKFSINSSGYIGIASSSPGYTLTVVGTGYISQPLFVGTPTNPSHAATKSYVDTLFTDGSFTTLTVSATTTLNGTTTINGNWNLAGAAIGNLNMNGNNIVGVNKLTVATIDPVYEIAGKKYSTYVSDTIGLKMEAYGKARLTKAGNTYRYALELSDAPRGSDLWLFWHTIDEGKDLEDISLSLTPEGGKASLWYKIEAQNKRVMIYGDAPVKFSYHLVAPRHDTKKWPTIMTPETDDGSAGTILPLR